MIGLLTMLLFIRVTVEPLATIAVPDVKLASEPATLVMALGRAPRLPRTLTFVGLPTATRLVLRVSAVLNTVCLHFTLGNSICLDS